MNNPNNLFNMMQTGGLTSTAGGTALARALQRQSDIKRLESQQRAEARRQKRGSLLGSIGSIAGGILGSIIPGVGTAIGAGIGAGLGRRIGEGLGAGKTKKYDTSGTVFGQQAFRDVQQASRDYTRGMGERALLSGAQTALKTYLSPGGGFFEKAGKDLQSGLGISTGIAPTASPIADTSLMDSLLKDTFSPRLSLSTSSYDPRSIPFTGGSPLIGYTQPIVENFKDGGFLKLRRGAYIPGNEGFREGFSGGINQNVDDGEDNIPDTGGTSDANFNSFTASGILGEAGLAPTSDQLALFQQFDPTQVQQAKTGAEQSLLSMTGGMGLSSLGGGFGGRQRAATSAIGRGEDLIGDTIEQEQRAYESQVLGTAADLIAGGAEFGKKTEDRTYVPTDNPNWNPPPSPTEGATYSFDGENYIYNGSEWLTEYEFYADEQAGQD